MKKTSILLVFLAVATLFSCNQLQQMSNMTKCEFRIQKVSNIELAGIFIQEKKSYADLNLLDAGKIATSLASGNLPLKLKLMIDIRNPNPTLAAMNKLDWILLIDDIEMLRGISNQRVEIPPQQTTTMPLEFQIDLKQVLTGESANTIYNFAFNLAGAGGEPTRVSLKAKPTILIGSIPVTYPGYITIKKDFTSK
jgi:hypothetical protein